MWLSFHVILYIYLSLKGNNGPTIHPAGDFVYPFHYDLNQRIPSSFSSTYGYVGYNCIAIIERPWRLNTSITEEFFVAHHLDCGRLSYALVSSHQRSNCHNKNVDIKFSAHDPFLEQSSSGTLLEQSSSGTLLEQSSSGTIQAKILETQINEGYH